MLTENQISKIGNGLYRMANNSNDLETLLYSISKGYNLIDTSSTYSAGKSELLVGEVIKTNPNLSDNLFIITKAGYCTEELPYEIKNYVQKECLNTAFIARDNPHCIDKFFIEYQFNASIQRLNRNYIDCFLIH